jgi:hypothetical protein
MPFDPNAFSEDMRRRKEQQATTVPSSNQPGFNAEQYAGDTSGQPQQTQSTVGDLATTAGLFGGSAAATAFGYGGPAVTPSMAMNAVGRPLVQSGGQLFQQYLADPFRAGRDIAASKVAPGVIPAQVVRGAAPEIASRIDAIVSRLPKGSDVMARQFLGDLSPDDLTKFESRVNDPKIGLEKAFKSFEAPKYIHGEAAEGLKFMKDAFPSGMSKLKTGAAMLGRTAARFAGPAGLALTAYDLYDIGSEMYDRYKQNQPAAPVAPTTPAAPAPQMAPVVPSSTGADTFDMDRRIREEAYRRAIGQR